MTTSEGRPDVVPGLGRAVLDVARHQLAEHADRIGHCVGQLDDAQVWWRPLEPMNSIANLLLHLGGNLSQWILSGAGDEPFDRDRPAEFAERSPIPRDELLAQFRAVIARVDEVLARLDESRLLDARRIQDTDQTRLSAIWHSIDHLGGHSQEIIAMTRMQLGDRYRFAWTPPDPDPAPPA